MTDPPRKKPENQELIDMLIAISVVARHLARKLEQASALQRGEGLPYYSRPDLQAKGEAEPGHSDRKCQNQHQGENDNLSHVSVRPGQQKDTYIFFSRIQADDRQPFPGKCF